MQLLPVIMVFSHPFSELEVKIFLASVGLLWGLKWAPERTAAEKAELGPQNSNKWINKTRHFHRSTMGPLVGRAISFDLFKVEELMRFLMCRMSFSI